MTEHGVSRRGALAVGLAVMLSAGMTLAACGGGEQSDGATAAGGALTKVSVGVIPIVDVAPLYLGISKGFFAKAGLEVTAKPAQGGAAIVPAVISAENQFGFSNVVSLLTARDKGLPLVSIAAGVSSTGDPANDVNAVLVAKDSPLKTAKDLEGRKIAVNSLNNIGDTTVKTAVAKAGGDPSKVTFVEMPFPDMPAQLAAGTIDAAWEAEPFRTQIMAAGGRILFDNLTETYPTLQVSHYFTSRQTKDKNPAMVAAFVTAINESMTYASSHPDEVRAVLATYTKISPEVAGSMALPLWPTTLDRASLTAVGNAARTYGTLAKDPDVAGLLGD